MQAYGFGVVLQNIRGGGANHVTLLWAAQRWEQTSAFHI